MRVECLVRSGLCTNWSIGFSSFGSNDGALDLDSGKVGRKLSSRTVCGNVWYDLSVLVGEANGGSVRNSVNALTEIRRCRTG